MYDWSPEQTVQSGGRYRVVSLVGTAALVALAVYVANVAAIQSVVTTLVPLFNRLSPTVLEGRQLTIVVAVTVVLLLGTLLPLFKPRPRRLLDIILLSQQRVLVGGLALATIGYFDYSYRLPRPTLVLTISLLLALIPLWFVFIRRAPNDSEERAIIIGDDYEQVDVILAETDATIVGYVSPPGSAAEGEHTGLLMTDGGQTTVDRGQIPPRFRKLTHLGGLSRLDNVLIKFDIDTAYLALSATDRGEFFGTLKACHEHGVVTKAHRNHVDSVLFDAEKGSQIVNVDLKPWDWQEYLFKRLFDITFAGVALLLTAPLIALITVAVKLDSRGPVLYAQERTAELGGTFQIYKFRSMLPESEDTTPVDDEQNTRITRVGGVLRRTHLDEIPQLWSILTGQMSVVGPRAAWVDEEPLLEAETDMWRKRWFVKPGLTGLAQINQVSSTQPDEKLRYDLAYIRRQSFWLDVKIVIRQLWLVVLDVIKLLRTSESDE